MDADGTYRKTAERGTPVERASRALAEPLTPPASESPPGALSPDPEIRETSVETAIVLELSVALLVDPPTQLTVIGVNNQEGIVTLSGEVGTQDVRRMAGEIASSHPGVSSAINHLEIHISSQPPMTAHEDETTNLPKGEHR
jgi:hypothetical protein